MRLLKKFLCLVFSLFVFLSLYKYKTVPSGKLWENYTVLYIPAQTEDSVVTSVFYEFGIEEFVSLNNQRVPILLKNNSVEKSMYKINSYNLTDDYLQLRQNYFYDSSKQYRLYYIPNQYKDVLSDCLKKIESNGINAGIDSNFSYPWLLPLISIILTLCLTFLSKNKIIYLFGSIFPVVYVFCNPFYACAVSSLLLLLILFMISNIWKREGCFTRLFKLKKFYFLSLLTIFLSISNSFVSFLFILLTVLGSASLLLIIKMTQTDIELKETYRYLYIRNARLTSLFAGKIKLVCGITCICIVLIFGYFILNLSDSFSGHFASVLLPGKSSISSKELPSLDDYCKWDWNIVTYPYKSLNKKNDDNTVVFPHYVKDNDKIKVIDQVYKYDDVFKNDVIQSIDNLDFYSIEQVLKSQIDDSVYGYTASSSYNVSVFSIIMIIITLCMLLFIYFSAIIKKGGRE